MRGLGPGCLQERASVWDSQTCVQIVASAPTSCVSLCISPLNMFFHP